MPIIAFLLGPIGRWIILAVAISGAAMFLRSHYINIGRAEVIAENLIQSNKIIVKQGAVTERVVVKYKEVAGKTETVTKTIEKEVYVYPNTTACLDADWRRLHDAAAANAVPEASGRVDDASRAPLAAEALETVTSNYARANRTADRLDALQEWARQQSAVK
jgi:hypothetical protein